jgi:hypothetical protein
LVKQDCVVIYRASIHSLMKITYNFMQYLNLRGSERAILQSSYYGESVDSQCLDQCFQTFSTSRYPWPRSSYLTVPLEENTYFFKKLIYFLIISYVRDKVVYFCSVSVYALINNLILFICFYIWRYP